MPTTLEMVFDFSPDDLSANQIGELTESQAQEYAKYIRESRVRSLVWPLIISTVLVAILINLLSEIQSSRNSSTLTIILLMGSFLGSIWVLRYFVHFDHFRASYRHPLIPIRYIRQSDFESDNALYSLKRDGLYLRFDLDKYNALDPGAVYTFYWQDGLGIASVDIHVGMTETLTPLGDAFNFAPSDLDANQRAQISPDQNRRLEAIRNRVKFERNEIIGLGLVITIFFVYVEIETHGNWPWILLLFPAAFWLYFTRMIIALHRTFHTFTSALSNPSVGILEDITIAGFNSVNTTINSETVPMFQFHANNIRIQLTPQQAQVLSPTATYRIFYFPAPDKNGINPILSIEQQEPS
jgi:hypothetical protein